LHVFIPYLALCKSVFTNWLLLIVIIGKIALQTAFPFRGSGNAGRAGRAAASCSLERPAPAIGAAVSFVAFGRRPASGRQRAAPHGGPPRPRAAAPTIDQADGVSRAPGDRHPAEHTHRRGPG